MLRLTAFWSLLVFVGFGQVALATPSRVILIRHAEKPADDNDPDLSAAGRARAQALVSFFTTNPVILEKAEPEIVFAMKAPHPGGTMRPLETLQAVAAALNVPIDNSVKDSKSEELIDDLLNEPAYDGKIVLVCWNHDGLKDLARGLGAADAPKWSGDTFDRFWVLDFNKRELSRFRDLPQHLMPGDSAL